MDVEKLKASIKHHHMSYRVLEILAASEKPMTTTQIIALLPSATHHALVKTMTQLTRMQMAKCVTRQRGKPRYPRYVITDPGRFLVWRLRLTKQEEAPEPVVPTFEAPESPPVRPPEPAKRGPKPKVRPL